MCKIRVLAHIRDENFKILSTIRVKEKIEDVSEFKELDSALLLLKTEVFDLLVLDICNKTTISNCLSVVRAAKATNPDIVVVCLYDSRTTTATLSSLVNSGCDRVFDIESSNDKKLDTALDDLIQIASLTARFRRYSSLITQFYTSIDFSPISIVITDLDGKIEFVNKKVETTTGYTEDELIGQKLSILKSGLHSTEFYKNLWDTILSGEIWRGQFCNKKKSGELFWESATIVPFKDEKGTIASFIGIKEDISSAREKDFTLNQILNNSPDLFFILNEDGTFLNAYPETDDPRYIIKRDEFLGKNITECFPSEITDLFFSCSLKSRETGEPQLFQYKENDRYFEANVKAFNTQKVLVILRDITDREEFLLFKALLSSIKEYQKSKDRLLNISEKKK